MVVFRARRAVILIVFTGTAFFAARLTHVNLGLELVFAGNLGQEEAFFARATAIVIAVVQAHIWAGYAFVGALVYI